MSITRLNYFAAKANRAQESGEFLKNVLPTIQAAKGCLSCELLQSQQSPTKFVVHEVWESVELHQTAVQAIPQEAFAGIMELLSDRPTGEYFNKCG
jgi:quinol monooxygenase YgiN